MQKKMMNKISTHRSLASVGESKKIMQTPMLSFHRPTARAKTPTIPAMLATMAPVGAGAPPVEVALEPADEADAAAAES